MYRVRLDKIDRENRKDEAKRRDARVAGFRKKIRWLEAELRLEDRPDTRAQLTETLAITRNSLAQLEASK